MKRNLMLAIFLGSFLLVGIQAAHAACVIPVTAAGALPPNDVSVDGFAFEVASIPLVALEVDMNGVQRGIKDERPWATHGTLVLIPIATGEVELIASWTQNTSIDSVEWVCRLKLDPGTTSAFGTGNFHSTVFGIGNVIDRCTMDLVADC